MPESIQSRSPSENDRFKRGWGSRLEAATVVSVVVHVAAFGLTARWRVPDMAGRDARWEARTLVALPPLDARSAWSGTAEAAAAIAEDDADSDAGEADEAGAAVPEDGREVMDLWDAIGERLRRRGAVVPSIVEPEDAPRDPPVDEADEAPQEIDASPGGGFAAVDLDDLPESDPLDLDRLASLQPELALQAASAWVLIRNPVEVDSYLRLGYLEGRLDPGERGSVSVMLWIDRDGSVEWAEITESSGSPRLDEYVLALFSEVAAFRAAREGGVAVSRSVTMSLNFPW